jgi:hypothetical protein
MLAREMLQRLRKLQTTEPDTWREPDALDEAEALAEMPDDEFSKQLRADIDHFQAGRAAAPPVERAPWDKPVRPKPRRKRYKRGFAR